MAYTDHPVWMFPVNWAGEVKETLEWRTDVLTSEVEAEQRIARRLTPRKTLTATFMLEKENRQYMQNMLARYGASDWLIPLWHQSSFLSAPALAGSSSLQLDTRWREYAVGGFIILRSRDPQIFEVGVIATLAANLVTLKVPLERNWPLAYTVAYPGAIARPDANVTAVKLLDNVQAINTNFSLAQTNIYPSEWVGDSYDGAPVLSIRPDDSEDLTLEYRRKQVIVDNELGVPLVYDISNRSCWVTQYRWSEAGREQLDALRRMLYWLRGAAKTIWVPTFMQDFTLAQPAAIGDQSLQVKNSGFARIHGVNAKATIQITLRSGAALRFSVTGASGGVVGSATEVLGLDAPLTQAVNPGEIAYICLLLHARLLDDTVEIRHPTDADGMSSVSVKFTSKLDGEVNSTLGGSPGPGTPGTGPGLDPGIPGGGLTTNPTPYVASVTTTYAAVGLMAMATSYFKVPEGQDCSRGFHFEEPLPVFYTFEHWMPFEVVSPVLLALGITSVTLRGERSGVSISLVVVSVASPGPDGSGVNSFYKDASITYQFHVAEGGFCTSGLFSPGALTSDGLLFRDNSVDFYQRLDNQFPAPWALEFLSTHYKVIRSYSASLVLLSTVTRPISPAEYVANVY